MRAMHLSRALLHAAVLTSFFSFANAANFTFAYGAPTQCDNFPVTWTGGTPPFELQFVPEFGTARTFSIPSDKFSNGKGSFEAQIPFKSNHTFVAVMSDSSGYGSGGISQILKVGDSVGSQSCNTTDPGVDFFFELNMALNQCRPYSFSGYANATQPVTISAIIPGGQAFFINPPKGRTFYSWTADVSAGTSILFSMTDANGKTGGSSDMKLVGFSDDSSCLGSGSPSSLAAIPTSTVRSAADSGSSTDKGSNTGVIIGGVLAALFGIATIISLALFFLRRRRRRSGFYGSGGYPYGGNNRDRIDSGDLDAPVAMQDAQNHPVVQPYPYTPTTVHAAQGSGSLSSHMSPSAHQLLPGQTPSQYSESRYDGRTQYTITNGAPSESMYSQNTHGPARSEDSSAGPSSPVSSAARRKAAMAGHTSYQPPRIIMHQDYEEAPPAEGDVVELPPQYSERRAPIPGLNDYTGPPPGAPGPSSSSNPLETEGGDNKRLQEPLSPSTPRSPPSGSRRS